jgi:RHS repeat-associated protein
VRIDPITWGTGINNKQFDVTTSNNRLAVPSGQSGTMSYDSAGNLTTDTYTGAGSRIYDAENRMTKAWGGNNQWQEYTYNADGQRVRRKVDAVETWQVYGFEGELLAEYAASGAATSPQKEYGYRNGQLLVTAESAAQIKWLVADQLGTPRMIFDKTGSLANVKRHDYLPFGEELFAGVGGRTTQNGYSGDLVRQKFTSKERDNETGLDYFLARYYSSVQGRFSSPDEFNGGPDELFDFANKASTNPTFYADLANPQSLNKYKYSYGNPLRYTDPDGHCPEPCPNTISLPTDQAASAALNIAAQARTVTTNTLYGPVGTRAYEALDQLSNLATRSFNNAQWGPLGDTVNAIQANPTVRVAQVIAGVAGAVEAGLANRALTSAAQSVANEARGLPATIRPTSAGVLQVDGQSFSATNRGGGLSPSAQVAYDFVPQSQRSAFHGRCCEGQLISKALNAGVDPRGGRISVVKVRAPGNPKHGTPLSPCSSCRAVLKFMGIN